MKYTVQLGDTPFGIALRITGNGYRWPELIAANPHKATQRHDVTQTATFTELEWPEELEIPKEWTT